MAQKKRSSTGTVILLLVGAVAIAGLCYFVYAYFQVRHVVAEGNAMYTGPYIAALAAVPEGTHMFQVDQESITERVENAEPYLRVAGVRRQYPDTLVISVDERRPIALLPYANQYLLVDADAVVLEPLNDSQEVDVPVVEGISVSGVEIGLPIETEDEFKISVMQEILRELNTRNLFDMIVSVDLSNINNIQLESAGGLRIRFGQAEKTADKVKWIANRLPALEREGQSDGILDVSAGSFATYTMMDGASATAEATESPEPSESPVAESSDDQDRTEDDETEDDDSESEGSRDAQDDED